MRIKFRPKPPPTSEPLPGPRPPFPLKICFEAPRIGRPRWHRDLERAFECLRETMLKEDYGHLSVRTMPRPFIIRLRDKFDEKPRTANLIVQVLSVLLQLGWDLGYCDSNVAARIKPLETGDGHRPWEEIEIKLYRKRWLLGTVERTAFELTLNTGQRGSDVIKMKRAHIGDDGMISVKQDKTDERVWIPISADLKEALAAWDVSQAE